MPIKTTQHRQQDFFPQWKEEIFNPLNYLPPTVTLIVKKESYAFKLGTEWVWAQDQKEVLQGKLPGTSESSEILQ